MNIRVTLIILSIVGGIAAIAIPLALNSNSSAIQREIANWSWGSYGITCPPMQAKAALMTRDQQADFERAVAWLNKAARRTLYTKTPQPGKPIVTVYGARPSHLEDDGLCGGKSLLGHLGRTYRRPTWINPITDFDILVCFGKIRAAQQFQNAASSYYESIKITARLGNIGHIAHELVHPYTGDRLDHSHPKHGYGLMLERPKSLALGPVVMGVLDRVDKHCEALGSKP